MNRKIICESCSTIFREELLGDKTICPVCGKSLIEEEDKSNWITWYYLKDKEFGGYSLWDKLPLYPDEFEVVQEFKAPPESDCGCELEEVKNILRTYIPNAFVFPKTPTPEIRCPRCFSTEFQLLPKRFSILTGIATNGYSRVCNHCGKKF